MAYGITATAWDSNTGTINIGSITGAIVITAARGYRNEIPLSLTADLSAVFNNGLGYQDGKYLSTSSATTDGTDANFFVTGFIPYDNDISDGSRTSAIYIKGADWTAESHCRLHKYSHDGSTPSFLHSLANGAGTANYAISYYWTLTILDADSKYWKIEPNQTLLNHGANLKYIRFSLNGSGADVIISIDEPIE